LESRLETSKLKVEERNGDVQRKDYLIDELKKQLDELSQSREIHLSLLLGKPKKQV
jgi:hypothetical protein